MSFRLGPLALTLALALACTEPMTIPPKTSKENATSSNPDDRPAPSKPPEPSDDATASTELGERSDAGERSETLDTDAGGDPDDAPTPALAPVDAGAQTLADAGATSPDAAMPTAPATPAPGKGVIGTWFGGLRDPRGPYTACVVVTQVDQEAGPAGTCAYGGSVNCRTSLTYRGQASGQYRFEEVQSSGAGCPPGITRLQLNPDNAVEYSWSLPSSEDILVSGTLVAVPKCPE